MTPVTVAQVVQSAYGWATGDVVQGEIMAPEDLYSQEDATQGGCGDRLAEFIISETGTLEAWYGIDGSPGMNSPEHWQEALRRMEKVQQEVNSVVAALERFAPEDA